MTHPLPATPPGLDITLFQMTGVHGAVWTYQYAMYPEGNNSPLAWRNPERLDWYYTVDQLNAAHGPLTWQHDPYPAEDRTRIATSTDGNQWQWSDLRGGWVQTVTPPADELDEVFQWNPLVYTHQVSY